MECPTKLYYSGKKEYKNANAENDFLKALAEGGFQVGELAKLYYPEGIEIGTLDYDQAIEKTESLLQNENVVIFEAAFQYEDLFIRADIVEKNGNAVRIVEVKSKSFDPDRDNFIGKKGGITSEWKPYVFDIAFQKHVLSKSHPELKVSAYLCLTDKSQKTTVEGLNQVFLLQNENGRTKVKISGDTQNLGNAILTEQCVDDVVSKIIDGEILPDDNFSSFSDFVSACANSYRDNAKIIQGVSGKCKSCEFIASASELSEGVKSGFHECWKEIAKFRDEDFERHSILDIWDFRRKDEFLSSGRYFMEEVTKEDLEGKSTKKQSTSVGLSRNERQYLQVEKARNLDYTEYLDKDGIKSEMAKWKFPLHFIDFETTAVAIPFNAHRRPYEQIAFQFSHHKVHEDGTIEHCSDWINVNRGIFPNFQFVRELKKVLEGDDGSIFRYAAHENSILNAVYIQLQESSEPDKQVLCDWIKTITKSKSDSVEKWEGERNMIDMLELVKRYYYNPMTKGSNSLKYVLPAVINSSSFIKEKYAQPIYGSIIKSRNYNYHSWIVFDDDDKAINPYRLLEPINQGYDDDLLDAIFVNEDMGIADGGSAMIAYSRMQFTEMGDDERSRISNALLRYCELDTFAMVILWEAWKNWCEA